MNKPVLIFTGGTLSAVKNDAGYLVPSHKVESLATEAGFDLTAALRPYTIDSIDFDIAEHYQKLRDTVLQTLNAGDVPVICGGTDTKIWYSTLLTKDLMRQGRLAPQSGEKVLFISSMKSLEDAPGSEHVKKILEAGKYLSEQPLSGGFALATEDETASGFVVHDVCNHFDKISSSLPNAFRTEVPIGYILGKHLHLNEAYHTPKTPSQSLSPARARIAPPLLRGHDSEAILAFMKAVDTAPTPFDGIIIEGLPSLHLLHKNDRTRLIDFVSHFKKRNIRVVFCNSLRFDNETLHPVVGDKDWEHPINGLAKQLADAGAEFVTALPKDAWLDMVLDTPILDHPMRPAPQIPSHMSAVLGIRYVPDVSIMKESIHALAPITKRLLFSALPHNVMPDALDSALEAHPKTHYFVTFEHNGTQYVTADGSTITEGTEPNPYQAGQGTRAILKTVHNGRDTVRIIAHRTHHSPFERQ